MSQPRSRLKGWSLLIFGILLLIGATTVIANRVGSRFEKMGAIDKIVQTGPDRRPLSSLFLQELLDLSIDKPVNLADFDCQAAEQKLLATHFVKEAHVQRAPPSTLYIDYTVRSPIAAIADYQNLAIDDEGILFPVSPYLSPKRLPEIYLGIDHLDPGEKITLPETATHILELFQAPSFYHLDLLRIDLKNALAPSLGRREIDLLVAHHLGPKPTLHTLRLQPTMIDPALDNYLTLLSQLITTRRPPFQDLTYKSTIVDLRLEGLAYLHEY